MNKYILVTGDRNYNDFKNIENILLTIIIKKYPPTEYTFINGDCKGADKICKYIFKTYKYKTIEYPADWNKYGKYAGPKRNKDMIDLKPELFLIFHNDISNSKGTKSCINIMLKTINENYMPQIIFNNKYINILELKKLIN